ncbi:MAG: hypothetical protein KIH64_007935, partial [Mycobacterium sp.]|nr:hypothetical protein [Mycobacterium sp.]
MDIVLGVSMTPTVVRMALVEGKGADGPTMDQDSFEVAAAVSAATSDAPEQVVAAILGTRESAAEGGHHLTATGVAWTDHAAAARLRQALRAQCIEDVILVSELHAASALAQALGEAADYERTALLFVERDTATLAVVRTADGSVVKVTSLGLNDSDAISELQEMVTGLEAGSQPAQALFVVGSGVDAVALKAQIAQCTALPVHAPDDGDLAMARGAALAAVNTPRYEATTVGLPYSEDTAAAPTQMAAAGYMAPLGYSAVPDDDDPVDELDADAAGAPGERRPFLLVGSALSTVFVVGVVALAISLAVAIRPTADQRPVPGGSAVVSNSAAPAPPQAQQPGPPETIQAPIPVVQEAPRPVFVAPDAVPAPAAPAPPPVAVPAAAPAPPSSGPAPHPPPAPAPAGAPVRPAGPPPPARTSPGRAAS